jgi:DNA replication initiation complex subunit (GINS family)
VNFCLKLFRKEQYNNHFKENIILIFMLTFTDIYEAMRKEKYSENLQILPKKFLVEVNEYFNNKKEFLNKEDDLFSDMAIKNKKKLDNAVSSFRDLLRIRKKKILNLAFVASQVGISKKDFENLMPFEKELFEELVKALEKAEVNQNADMNGAASNERKHRLVRFLEDVPEFLGFDGSEVGPFSKGEVANIESEIVEILSKDNRIEVI